MHINAISYKNFRNIERATIKFVSPVTILRGDNRAGKTNCLLGIPWCLLGYCEGLTTRAGGNWAESMRTRGAGKDMGVVLDLANYGAVKRTRSNSNHSLQIPNSTNVKPAYTQERLLEQLGVHAEALAVITDPMPFVDRPPATQRDALTKILQPASIDVTDQLRAAGVEQILGVEHLERLIKEYAEEHLRDANRTANNLRKNPRQEPEWPWPGLTEDKIRLKYDAICQDIEALKEQQTQLRRDVEHLEDELSREEPVFELVDGYDVKVAEQEKRRQAIRSIEEQREAISMAKQAIKEDIEGIGTKQAENAAKTARNNARLAAMTDPVECSAAECPVLTAHRSRVAEARESLKEEQASLSGEAAKLSKERAELQEKLGGIQGRHAELEAEMKEVAEVVVEQERILNHHREQVAAKKAYESVRRPRAEVEAQLSGVNKQLDEIAGKLEAANGKKELGDQTIERIRKYHLERKDALAYEDDLTKAGEKASNLRLVVDALKEIKESIVGDRIKSFLGKMGEVLDAFGLQELGHTWSDGFIVNGLPVRYESDGATRMIFETAFRIAVARATGLRFMLLDHRAPLSNEIAAKLASVMLRQSSAHKIQVIQTVTSTNTVRPNEHAPFQVWYVSEGDVRPLAA